MATKNQPRESLFYTLDECAAIYGCHPCTMWRRAKARALKGQQGGGRGRPYKVLKTAFHKQHGIPE